MNSIRPFLLLSLLLLASCASRSPDSNFFLLSARQPAPDSTGNSPVVGVGPLELARYLDAQPLVSRRDGVQLEVDEFNRWAGDHGQNIVRVLAQNLSHLLASEAVLPYPWHGATQLDYQLLLNIDHFEPLADGRVLLDAQWQLFDRKHKQMARIYRSRLHVPVSGNHIKGRVEAQNQALLELAEQMAAAIRQLHAVD